MFRVCVPGARPHSDIQSHPHIRQHLLTPFTSRFPRRGPCFLLFALCKIIWQLTQLLWTLCFSVPRSDYLLVQVRVTFFLLSFVRSCVLVRAFSFVCSFVRSFLLFFLSLTLSLVFFLLLLFSSLSRSFMLYENKHLFIVKAIVHVRIHRPFPHCSWFSWCAGCGAHD